MTKKKFNEVILKNNDENMLKYCITFHNTMTAVKAELLC